MVASDTVRVPFGGAASFGTVAAKRRARLISMVILIAPFLLLIAPYITAVIYIASRALKLDRAAYPTPNHPAHERLRRRRRLTPPAAGGIAQSTSPAVDRIGRVEVNPCGQLSP